MLKTNFEDIHKFPTMEAYFGASGNLGKIVKNLEKITSQIRGLSEMEMATLNINESKENLEICALFEKEFGFQKMILCWDTSASPNAFTIPGGLILESNPDPGQYFQPRNQKDRYYDRNHRYTCIVVVMMNLVRILDLNARETMGVILHEIGHNFDNTGGTTAFNLILAINSLGLTEILYAVQRHLVLPGKALIQNKFPWLWKILDIPESLAFNLNLFPVSILDLSLWALRPDLLIQQVIFGLMRQGGEEYSDEFAATHGFGPDLASATAKMADHTKMNGFAKRAMYSIPVIRTLYDLCECPVMSLIQLFDEHPYDENRIGNIARKLEKDYNSPQVPKAMKPEIKKQLAMVYKLQRQNAEMSEDQQLYATMIRQKINAAIKGNKIE